MPALSELLSVTRGLLTVAAEAFPPAVFTTSFGAEDMVLLDLVAREFPVIAIATLDTGRLPEATYTVWQIAVERYGCKIQPFFPQAGDVEYYVQLHGINGFRESVAQRKACCHVRKVEPLRRALAGRGAWITGLRSGQSSTRQVVPASTYDHDHALHKFNPLAEWSEADIWSYIRAQGVPYNSLHDQGYPSIGCGPCTRAITTGEDLRAGRWWWEDPQGKECGMHSPHRPIISVVDSRDAATTTIVV